MWLIIHNYQVSRVKLPFLTRGLKWRFLTSIESLYFEYIDCQSTGVRPPAERSHSNVSPTCASGMTWNYAFISACRGNFYNWAMKQNGVAMPFNAKISVSTMTDFPLNIPEVVPPFQKSSHPDAAAGVKQKVVTVVSSQGSAFSKLSPYLIALRPWSFTVSLGPVALGSCLAYKSLGVFNAWIFGVTCICALSVHAAGNLVNTYVDFTKVSWTEKLWCNVLCNFLGILSASWFNQLNSWWQKSRITWFMNLLRFLVS